MWQIKFSLSTLGGALSEQIRKIWFRKETPSISGMDEVERLEENITRKPYNTASIICGNYSFHLVH